jgi:signal transduction histidine kinase
LFEPFVRGRRTPGRPGLVRPGRDPQAQPGHGLGLAIVRDVARAHGGHAAYEPGAPGSVFTFTVALRTPAVVE